MSHCSSGDWRAQSCAVAQLSSQFWLRSGVRNMWEHSPTTQQSSSLITSGVLVLLVNKTSYIYVEICEKLILSSAQFAR